MIARSPPWALGIPQLIVVAASWLLFTLTAGQDLMTPTLYAQPAMFGAKWTRIPTTFLRTISFDLCNQTQIDATKDDIFRQSNSATSGEALFFDAVEMSSECTYADMAKAAETLFPTARYLLISRVDLLAMTKFPREPETTLSLAAVTLEDAQAIKSGFSSSNPALIPNGGGAIQVTIDAVSRALIDVCDCPADNEQLFKDWTLILRISSSLSIIGSMYIIYNLAGSMERRLRNMPLLFNRLLLATSFCDLISSIAIFVGRWAFATTPPGDFERYFSLEMWELENPGAMGTEATCAMQGVMVHLGSVGSCLFTCFLAIHTLLVVRYGWKKDRMDKMEYLFFVLGIAIPLIGATAAASTGLLNKFDIGFCWIRKFPANCDYDYKEGVGDDGRPKQAEGGPLLDPWCEEVYLGEKSFLKQLAMGLIWILIALLISLGCMISLFLFVRDQENRAAQWVLTARDGRNQKLVLARAIMYFAAFVSVWLPSILALAMGTPKFNYVVASLMPLQGFFNALICSGFVDKCCLKPKPEERDRSTSYRFTDEPCGKPKSASRFSRFSMFSKDSADKQSVDSADDQNIDSADDHNIDVSSRSIDPLTS